jgi:hypothetical protein
LIPKMRFFLRHIFPKVLCICPQFFIFLHILPVSRSVTFPFSEGFCPHSSSAPCGGTFPPGEGIAPSALTFPK